MTAVASPPSVQPLPRWNSGDVADSLDSMSTEEVSQMFMPRKSIQRQNSSSNSSSKSTSSILSPPMSSPQINGDNPSNGDQGAPLPRKKAARGVWPSSKAEPVSGISTARPQGIPTPSSGQSAASTMNSAINQNASILPSHNRPHLSQPSQNGGRMENTINSGEATAILALLPMTGTFERKQINVPFFPDTLRIGRQTNAKTIPTAVNGYFDSKVLSRQHAEVWADRNGKIWIRDVKSSNGTFVNGVRLSPENRDSEPHELREQDTLELGIDIVSEDQKSIVHHKVSAKVELAGMYSSTPTLVDVIHVDPSSGQQLSGDSMGQPLNQMRGRVGQGSVGSSNRMSGPPSLAGNNGNLMGPQRQMNMWMAPITVEQVVRKLTTELKQAKQQSRDLHRTTDFFGTLMTLEPGKEFSKSPQQPGEEEPAAQNDPAAQQDVISPEAISPFSQPPAPPPQQPLPSKPESSRVPLNERSIKRTETERPKPLLDSPDRLEPQNGQLMSLVEALKVATAESDMQGDRIKFLEMALKRERKARETAERRALALSGGRGIYTDAEDSSIPEDDTLELPLDSVELMYQDLPNGHTKGEESEEALRSSASMETLRNVDETQDDTQEIEASTSRLQARLDLMMKEMDEMKKTMESYKRRAEDAEEGRRSLAEMVENIRAGREPQQTSQASDSEATTLVGSEPAEDISLSRKSTGMNGDAYGLWTALRKRQLPNGNLRSENMQDELERTLSNVLQQQRATPNDYGRIGQSAPYVSMVGVVIIGVGIMTWLNGWQPGGER